MLDARPPAPPTNNDVEAIVAKSDGGFESFEANQRVRKCRRRLLLLPRLRRESWGSLGKQQTAEPSASSAVLPGCCFALESSIQMTDFVREELQTACPHWQHLRKALPMRKHPSSVSGTPEVSFLIGRKGAVRDFIAVPSNSIEGVGRHGVEVGRVRRNALDIFLGGEHIVVGR